MLLWLCVHVCVYVCVCDSLRMMTYPEMQFPMMSLSHCICQQVPVLENNR